MSPLGWMVIKLRGTQDDSEAASLSEEDNGVINSNEERKKWFRRKTTELRCNYVRVLDDDELSRMICWICLKCGIRQREIKKVPLCRSVNHQHRNNSFISHLSGCLRNKVEKKKKKGAKIESRVGLSQREEELERPRWYWRSGRKIKRRTRKSQRG